MPVPIPPEDKEGVVKYRMDFTSAPPLPWPRLAQLDAWRTLLFRLGLNGRDPERYGGLAYGNVSQRDGANGFIISGTQTGGLERLSAEDYCLVTGFDTERNRVVAEGPVRPSSEALTHAAVYRAANHIQCVLHVHSPELWNCAKFLSIPMTSADIAYGTPAMAEAVESLLRTTELRIIAMGGHRDGLIALGETIEAAAMPLIRGLAEAVRIEREQAG
jgi:hypothetical protein